MLGTYGQVASHFGLIHGKTTAGEFGGIVGKGNLSGIVTDSSSRWADPGCKHWQITDRTELPFVQCKGQLRLWDCPEDIIEQYRKLEIKL